MNVIIDNNGHVVGQFTFPPRFNDRPYRLDPATTLTPVTATLWKGDVTSWDLAGDHRTVGFNLLEKLIVMERHSYSITVQQIIRGLENRVRERSGT